MQTPTAPTHLFDYEVLSQLGTGAASSVYAVSDPKTGQVYAIKHVIRKDEKSQRFVDQLANEFAVSQKIGHHPNIRHCHELKFNRTLLRTVIDAGLVMELIDASPLVSELKTRGHADLAFTLPIMRSAAHAMAAIKAAGYVHCDMKPENIMVLGDGSVKIIDLGQACPAGTVKDRVQGSPNFIAPEQMKGEPVTFRTDVFNYGATLYWALTGNFVPTEYRRKKGLAKGKSDDAPAPAELNPAISPELSALVMDCVRSKVMDRPDAMTVVAARFEAIIHPVAIP